MPLSIVIDRIAELIGLWVLIGLGYKLLQKVFG